MARPREFDEDSALEAAIQCFWTHGYEASSVRDLADGMGITVASLYNAFGDKRALYLRALARYVERSFGERIARLEGRMPPRAAIVAFFREIVDRSLGDPLCKGCMMVNAALEAAPGDPEFQRTIDGILGGVESFFLRCVAAGQREGAIAGAHSPQDLARLLLATLLGIRVMARVRPQRELFEGMLRPVLALLDGDGAGASRPESRRG